MVDTSVWIDYLNNHDTPAVVRLDMVLAIEKVAVGDVVLCEILQGIRTEARAASTLRILSQYEQVAMVSPAMAVRAASNYRYLRQRGITIRSSIDCFIATAVIAGHHVLLHNDRDFDHFEEHLGLQVLHP